MKPLLHLPLSELTLDPDTLARTDTWVWAAVQTDEATRVVVMDEAGRPAVAGEGLDYRPLADVDGEERVLAYLGRGPDGVAYVLSVGPAVDGLEYKDVRGVVATMPDFDRGVVVPAVALANWHRLYRFCPRCGHGTVPVQAGWVRRCESCDTQHFPRIDPAVIMAVIDGADRLLLAHAGHFPERRYSTIAGYVEPGENLEHAVVRETWEEVGLNVTRLEYRGSQPWPFPRSLMFAYTAYVDGTPEPVVDGEEITHARFFTRDELVEAVAAGEILPPGRASVARALVEDWLGGELAEPVTFGV